MIKNYVIFLCFFSHPLWGQSEAPAFDYADFENELKIIENVEAISPTMLEDEVTSKQASPLDPPMQKNVEEKNDTSPASTAIIHRARRIRSR